MTKWRRREKRWTIPQGPKDNWAQAGGSKGGRTDAGQGGVSRHAERGAEMRGRGWRLAGGGGVQLDNELFQERTCGAGEREQCSDVESYCQGGGGRGRINRMIQKI